MSASFLVRRGDTKRSADRILTTHVGSLIRPPAIQAHLRAIIAGEGYDEAAHNRDLTAAVAQIVTEQVDAGIDIVSDGELGKPLSWSTYALERLSGFERRPLPEGQPTPFQRESEAATGGGNSWDSVVVGPIEYTGQDAVKRDLDNLRTAFDASGATEAFFTAAAPASVIPDRKNEFYSSDDECLEAIAAAMATEYKMVTDAGFILQLDDARAAVTFDRMVPPGSFDEYRAWLAHHVDLLNRTIAGLPESQIRYHVCWGSWPGPHTTDVPLADIVDLFVEMKVGAYVIEGANPRHEHEWKVWQDTKLPEGRVLIPGLISHATNIVEHPKLVADRIIRYASVVGRENIIAGTDCGFAQSPFVARVHPSIVWAKFNALSEGARLASEQLW
jgi:5-methyltetrahydropteroyltriglutamate--homocysteine methyltransferase